MVQVVFGKSELVADPLYEVYDNRSKETLLSDFVSIVNPNGSMEVLKNRYSKIGIYYHESYVKELKDFIEKLLNPNSNKSDTTVKGSSFTGEYMKRYTWHFGGNGFSEKEINKNSSFKIEECEIPVGKEKKIHGKWEPKTSQDIDYMVALYREELEEAMKEELQQERQQEGVKKLVNAMNEQDEKDKQWALNLLKDVINYVQKLHENEVAKVEKIAELLGAPYYGCDLFDDVETKLVEIAADGIAKNLFLSKESVLDWINYYIYETDCGKETLNGEYYTVTLDNDEEVEMNSIENLFKVIIADSIWDE